LSEGFNGEVAGAYVLGYASYFSCLNAAFSYFV